MYLRVFLVVFTAFQRVLGRNPLSVLFQAPDTPLPEWVQMLVADPAGAKLVADAAGAKKAPDAPLPEWVAERARAHSWCSKTHHFNTLAVQTSLPKFFVPVYLHVNVCFR